MVSVLELATGTLVRNSECACAVALPLSSTVVVVVVVRTDLVGGLLQALTPLSNNTEIAI